MEINSNPYLLPQLNNNLNFSDLTKESTKNFYTEYNPYTGDLGATTVLHGTESIVNYTPEKKIGRKNLRVK